MDGLTTSLPLPAAPPIREASSLARGMTRVCLLDTYVGSQNLGDGVIMDAVDGLVEELFPDSFRMRIPTHEFMLWSSYGILRQSDHIFVGGSNLLKSKMEWRNQWKLSPLDGLFLRNVTLVGCGWWHYQPPPTPYSRAMLRRVLSATRLHSVRDDYTRQQLGKAGLANVANTACPSMWRLTPAHCAAIPARRARRVVTTMTGYNPDRAADRAVTELLLDRYEEVWLWVQQPEDHAYSLEIGGGRLRFLPPTLEGYTRFLEDQDTDYVGSRLHGGIRALQRGRRTLILAVDNRATEISRDTGLPVQPRHALDAIAAWIDGAAPTRIRLPEDAIARFKDQFRAEGAAAGRR